MNYQSKTCIRTEFQETRRRSHRRRAFTAEQWHTVTFNNYEMAEKRGCVSGPLCIFSLAFSES